MAEYPENTIIHCWLKFPVCFFESDIVDVLMSEYGSDYVVLYQFLFIEAVKGQRKKIDDDCISDNILKYYDLNFILTAIKLYNELHIDSVENNGLIPKFKRLVYRNRNCPEYKEWRERVFARDKFMCQNCGRKNVQLNAHHIQHWANNKDLRFDTNNGVTLCVECHKKIHKKENSTNNVKTTC